MPFCKYFNCIDFPERIENGIIVKRLCYYEPGCWKGQLDSFIDTLRIKTFKYK